MHNSVHTSAQSAPPTPLFVHQAGVGTPLLLIHGLMVSGAMYQPVLPALTMYYRVIVPDLRGYGRSASLPGPYSVEQHAHDLAQLLDDLQIDAADIVGYSQGGAVAQQFAYYYPKRVRSLVLTCAFAYSMLSYREQLKGMLSPWLVRILGLHWLARFVIYGTGGRRISTETARWLQEIMTANEKARMVEAVEAMKAFDSRPWLHQITCPTLVIAGAEDTAVPLAHAQMLAQGIPDVQLRVVDGAGHTLIWTDTNTFVQAIEAFFAAINKK